MKILYITYGRANNAHLVKWVQAAIDQGHDCRLVCLRKSSKVLDLPTVSINTHASAFTKIFVKPIAALISAKEILAFEPDVVHVHGLDPWISVLGFVWHPRVVISIWGADLADPTFMLNECFRRLAMRRARSVVATNLLLEYMCRAHVGMDPKVRVIPFGVDCERFQPVARAADGVFRVGFVKHLEPIYGLEYLLRALAQVREELPRWELLVAGEGSLAASLKDLAQGLGIGGSVRFVGRVPNEEVPALLQSCDVFAMPSLYESFGVCALEAAACGLPVVASKAGGIPDVVAHERTGLLVPPRDPRALAQALLRLARDPELARELGERGREMVLQQFQWKDCVSQMEELYASLAASGRTSKQ